MIFKFAVLATIVAFTQGSQIAAPSPFPPQSYSYNSFLPYAPTYNFPYTTPIARSVIPKPLVYSTPYAKSVISQPLSFTNSLVAQPLITAPLSKPVIPYTPFSKTYASTKYDFGYAVSDSLTGDHKSQQETRLGDVVKGSYSLIDSDGTKRTVDYTADDVNGFNAVVHKEPTDVKIAAPITYLPPAIKTTPLRAFGSSTPFLDKYATPTLPYSFYYGSRPYASALDC